MANYIINSANSVFGPGRRVSDVNAGTLTVTADGFGVSTDDHSVVVNQNWTMTILGTIGTHAAASAGVFLASTGLATASNITIGTGGDLFGTNWGLFADHRTNIVNKGAITATTANAIHESSNATGNYKITNFGAISGAENGIVLDGTGVHTIVNSGTISGALWAILGQTSTFVGIEKVTNSGTLNGQVELGLGDDSFTNSGTVNGGVSLGEGNNSFKNSGKISGVVSGSGSFVNSGTITGLILLSAGNDAFVNSGTITSLISLRDGDDTFTNFAGKKQGHVTDSISLGRGEDIFKGGKSSESVIDGAGNDVYKFGGGNDTYDAHSPPSSGGLSGDDIVDGGTGIDTYDAGGSTESTNINLSTGVATGVDIATDTISGFENVIGSSHDDIIVGNIAANRLEGGFGLDQLFGMGGNDVLIDGAGVGGDNPDVLDGGAGKDTLTGGADQDEFQFSSAVHSGVGVTKRDVITDFNQSELDFIDLHLIDAATNIAGDQEFHLVGNGGLAAFTPVGIPHLAGELRYKYAGGNTIIEGDINSDAKADFQIELKGHYLLIDGNFSL